ncbi:MAG: hypothetical protein COV67_09300 [Nitrospinae bacterium CG11_big_fil_rev_8_21_14_0_20_56_8]|nr:MAG: hypothetical protein COV67_09300 [Nitrospinae bacterium CG11_big_fil_rev_8_21_14_0_20_56_8]
MKNAIQSIESQNGWHAPDPRVILLLSPSEAVRAKVRNCLPHSVLENTVESNTAAQAAARLEQRDVRLLVCEGNPLLPSGVDLLTWIRSTGRFDSVSVILLVSAQAPLPLFELRLRRADLCLFLPDQEETLKLMLKPIVQQLTSPVPSSKY